MFVWFVFTLRIESDLKFYLYKYLVVFFVLSSSISYGNDCSILYGVAPGFKQMDPYTLLSKEEVLLNLD